MKSPETKDDQGALQSISQGRKKMDYCVTTPSLMFCRSRYPSSCQILFFALSLAIFLPSAASKFSGLAQADSPSTVYPFSRESRQAVNVEFGNTWYCSETMTSSSLAGVTRGAVSPFLIISSSTSVILSFMLFNLLFNRGEIGRSIITDVLRTGTK